MNKKTIGRFDEMAEAKKFPREVYKKIKQMNNEQLYDFLISFYNDGKKETLDFVRNALDMNSLREQIGCIKGIGAARLDDIMSVVEAYINDALEERDAEEDNG